MHCVDSILLGEENLNISSKAKQKNTSWWYQNFKVNFLNYFDIKHRICPPPGSIKYIRNFGDNSGLVVNKDKTYFE